ncbi:MAG: DUF3160 domain-containing protein [Thermoplasmata archaeon]|nr:DUF3160 domain-containing protein [Thermoplasmata archaeon]
MKSLSTLLVAAAFVAVAFSGCVEQQTNPAGTSLIILPPLNTIQNPKYAISSHHRVENISVNATVPQYPLPLNLTSVVNINNVTSVFHLTSEQQKLLEENGFVVVDYGSIDDIVKPYDDLKKKDVPIFVTSDTLLHLYHIQFDETLKGIEEREFFDDILGLSKALFDKAKTDYSLFTQPDLKEAARRNVAYFAVALKLLSTPTSGYNNSEKISVVDFTVPDYVKNEVNNEVDLIDSHHGFSESPIFHYMEDYSQYLPRGHYTQSEKLRRYFKTLMWFGRMAFLLKGGDPHCSACDFLVSEYDARIATLQASLISAELPVLNVNGVTAENLWERIYSVTSFFVGTADDLTPYEYLECIAKVFGSEFNVTEFVNNSKLFDLKLELTKLRNPRIYGGTGECELSPDATVEDLNRVLVKTKGLRFMGQRFIPDSYVFQQMVFPAVDPYLGNGTPFTLEFTGGGPARCFPRGLDFMAVLGSKRALEIIEREGDTEYGRYYEQLHNLSENFSKLNLTEWNRNLYFSWVYTLKSLLKEFNGSYPTFMQTNAWQDKELQTVLASWAELRHDTILYGKQSYTPTKTSWEPPPKPVVGYVEPVPEFYTRLLSLTRMTKDGLTDLGVLNETEKNRLMALEDVLVRLANISKMELENKELTESDYEFIRNFASSLENVVAGVKQHGKETTVVADVHTDQNTKKCLEEAVGYVDILLVAYKLPDGRVLVGAGPVFSYYEFKQPITDRLTDEKWRELLLSSPPDRLGWMETFVAE